jgi:hypothetical protein
VAGGLGYRASRPRTRGRAGSKAPGRGSRGGGRAGPRRAQALTDLPRADAIGQGSALSMTDIVITPLEPGRFRAEVIAGHLTTSHRVLVPDGFLKDLGVTSADSESVVRETMRFLLEREPATSILPEFSLEDVPRYFPDFYENLRLRLSA